MIAWALSENSGFIRDEAMGRYAGKLLCYDESNAVILTFSRLRIT
jgi:hypothetical protein